MYFKVHGVSHFLLTRTALLHDGQQPLSSAHLMRTNLQVVGELPLQVGLVLLKLEDILLQPAVILLQGL